MCGSEKLVFGFNRGFVSCEPCRRKIAGQSFLIIVRFQWRPQSAILWNLYWLETRWYTYKAMIFSVTDNTDFVKNGQVLIFWLITRHIYGGHLYKTMAKPSQFDLTSRKLTVSGPIALFINFLAMAFSLI